MNKKKGILLSIVVLMLGGTLFSWCSEHKVDARELAMFQVLVQVVDAETNEPLNASVRSPSTALSKFDERNPIYCVEMTPPGLIRASWVDFRSSDSSITLGAEGYSSIVVPSDIIEKREGITSLAGTRTPDLIKLEKTQPVGAINSEAAASPR